MRSIIACLAVIGVLGLVAGPVVEVAAQADAEAEEAAAGDAASSPNDAATVTAQRGKTEACVADGEEWAKTEVGRAYAAGTDLKTGKRSYIEICLDEANGFRIKSSTQVKVGKILDTSYDESGKVVRLVELQLAEGEVSARLAKLPKDVRVRITTPTAIAGASGTGYTVGFNSAERLTLVEVVDKAVLVEALDRANKSVTVSALQQVEVRSWKGGKITATGHGVLSEALLGKEFVEKFRQKPEDIRIVATAAAPAPEDVADRDGRRAESEAAALDAARAQLTAIVLQLAVDESTTVNDLLAKNDALGAKVYDLVAAAPVIGTVFGDDDSCTITVRLPMAAIARALGRDLPGTIASVEEIAKADYLKKFGAQPLESTTRAAVVDAQRRIAGKINGSVVEAERTLGDVALRDARVRTTITGVVRDAVVEEEYYFSDGSVTVFMTSRLGQVAENHPEIVGDVYLSSPEPVVLHDFNDFMEYRFMRERVHGGAQRVGRTTQGKLAATIVKSLGLAAAVDPGATEMDYANLCAKLGVGPLGGWNLNAEVTDETLALILVQLFGWTSEVKDPTKLQDLLDVLEKHGVLLGSVRDVLNEMGVVGPLVIVLRDTSLSYEGNLSSVRGR